MVTSPVTCKCTVFSASVLCTGSIVIVQVGANKELSAKKGGARNTKNLNLNGCSLAVLYVPRNFNRWWEAMLPIGWASIYAGPTSLVKLIRSMTCTGNSHCE